MLVISMIKSVEIDDTFFNYHNFYTICEYKDTFIFSSTSSWYIFMRN